MSELPRILVTCKQMQTELPEHVDRIRSAGFEPIAPTYEGQYFTSRQLVDMTDGVVGVIAGDDELDRAFFEGSSELRVLIRWGIGMDSVDHDAARDCGVIVRNTPGVFGQEVADSAFAYVLLLARGHHIVDSLVRRGEWPKHEGVTLAGSTLGVVGFGAIGRAIADRAIGFGMDVTAFDPYAANANLLAGVELVGLTELLRNSAFVVLACPLTDETFHLINQKSLALMSDATYLINVARGPVVDEAALIDALRNRSIAGAGLDVFEVEPLPMDSPLREFPNNVILGAHNGSNTREGVEVASSRAVDFLLEELVR